MDARAHSLYSFDENESRKHINERSGDIPTYVENEQTLKTLHRRLESMEAAVGKYHEGDIRIIKQELDAVNRRLSSQEKVINVNTHNIDIFAGRHKELRERVDRMDNVPTIRGRNMSKEEVAEFVKVFEESDRSQPIIAATGPTVRPVGVKWELAIEMWPELAHHIKPEQWDIDIKAQMAHVLSAAAMETEKRKRIGPDVGEKVKLEWVSQSVTYLVYESTVNALVTAYRPQPEKDALPILRIEGDAVLVPSSAWYERIRSTDQLIADAQKRAEAGIAEWRKRYDEIAQQFKSDTTIRSRFVDILKEHLTSETWEDIWNVVKVLANREARRQETKGNHRD